MDSAPRPPLLAPAARSARWILVPILGVPLVLGGVIFFFDPARYGFYPRCALHEWTSLYCPGCGSLRAIHQLLHGRIVASIACNALLVAWAPVLAWAAVRQVAGEVAGRWWAPSLRHPLWLWAFLASAVLFVVVRNLPGADAMRPPPGWSGP